MLRKKILVVEDEPVLRDLCAAILRHHDFDSIIAVDGLDALETYRERHEEICLVLSDVTMPRMDGIELARKLFEIHSHANVILMSGYSMASLVPEEFKKLCAVVQKPFTAGRLVEAVQHCLKHDAKRRRPMSSSG